MIVIRGTAPFRSRVAGTPLGTHESGTGLLGEWFANVKLWRPQIAIFVHRSTFLPVVVPLAPAAGVIDRFGELLDEVLLALGVPASTVADEREHRGTVRVAPTDDRTVVGVMNEYVNQMEWMRDDLGRLGPDDLVPASLELAGMPVGPLRGRGSFPDRAAVALLGSRPALASEAVRARRRGWMTLRVELVEGRGEFLWPRPGRLLAVRRAATFAQLSDAIDAAFARWDRGHLHRFVLAGGVEIVHVADWRGDAPEGAIDDAVRLDRLEGGEQLVYEFDLGDGWMHLCTVVDGDEAPPVGRTPVRLGPHWS